MAVNPAHTLSNITNNPATLYYAPNPHVATARTHPPSSDSSESSSASDSGNESDASENQNEKYDYGENRNPITQISQHRSPQQPAGKFSEQASPRNPVPTKSLDSSSPETLQHQEDDAYNIRHGWHIQYGPEQLRLLATNFYMYYNDKRHENNGGPKEELKAVPSDWRMRDRLKTVTALLAVCLNIGVDPPDAFKTNPCARLECWIDPTESTAPASHNAINQIGKTLQTQYEQLSVRTRYKISADPTVEEIKKHTHNVRRGAKDERVLFHYNGHGVPKPTASGEIWVFNKDYTQYIPIPLPDLQSWLSAPTLFVYDCSEAGLIIKNFVNFVEKYERDHTEHRNQDQDAQVRNFRDCIHLAACNEKENLPTNPDLPADLFTSCLTTPIEIGVRFFMMRNPLPSNLKLSDASNIPGRSQERRTPVGELNWIFTAITDTIAWNSLPKQLFKRLFRQDLMVAALFRNFLLAQRIMRIYHCHPQSYPEIPSTHDHPLWQSWDLAVEMVLAQLPNLKLAEEKKIEYQYQHSDFFFEQLTAFEVYLGHGAKEQQEPEQLPIVLQVLLSQSHRLRALVLLSKFLDLGPWAVELALSIGIFPYVLKLLQSQAVELKPPLVFIWARILAVDQSCQTDLLKDNGYQYFVGILHPNTGLPVRDVSEHRAMCAFIIAMFCRNFKQGQVVAQSAELVDSCLSHISLNETEHPLLRQWSCLCLSMLWKDYSEAKWAGIRSAAHLRLCELTLDPVPEVRAAMINALTTFIGIPDLTDQVAEIEEIIIIKLLPMADDGSSLVRKELTVFLSTFVYRYREAFAEVAFDPMMQEAKALKHKMSDKIKEVLKFDGLDKEARLASWTNAPDPTLKYSSALSLNVSNGTHHNHNLETPGNSYESSTGIANENVSGSFKANSTRGSFVSNGTSNSASSEDLHSHAAAHSSEETFKLFTTVWKYILLLSVDPDPQVAANASNIVDYVIQQISANMGMRARLVMDIVSDASRSRLTLENDLADEYALNGISHLSASPSSVSLFNKDIYSVGNMRRTASVGSSLRNMGQRADTYDSSGGLSSIDPLTSQTSSWTKRGVDTSSTTTSRQNRSSKDPSSSHPIRIKDAESQQISMPLDSDFFEWSMEYFKEPQMRQTESDEPGSTDYNRRLWRRSRNERILEITQKMKEQAGGSRWDHQVGHFDNGRQPTTMCFHQYEDHLAIADRRDIVRIWDWHQQSCLNKFSNGNPSGSIITGTRFINEDDQALLMTGSSDGVVRVFSNYDSPKDFRAVSAFRSTTDVHSISAGGNFVFDWVQGRGHILVAGDASKEIQIWSARSETCFFDIPLGANATVTSLTSDQLEGYVFAAGFADGGVRVYDQRLDPTHACVREWAEHQDRIVNIHMQRGGQRELVAGSTNGEIKFWDIRHRNSYLTVPATRDKLRSLSVHEHAPVFATGSERHNIKVFNMKGLFLSSFEPLNSFMHQNRSAPIATTMFHPHRMLLACASIQDSQVTLFSCMSRVH